MAPHNFVAAASQLSRKRWGWGYVYAVCNRGHYSSIKIGLTTIACVERYLHESYSRALSPLEIIFVIPVANARLAESLLHHILAQHRVDERHELFDLSQAMDKLQMAKEAVLLHDEQSGLPKPTARPVSLEHWKVFNKAAQEGARKQRKRKAERESDLLKEEAARVHEDKRVAAQAAAETKSREDAEKKLQLRQQQRQHEADRVLNDLQRLQADMRNFIRTAVEEGQSDDYIGIKPLYEEFVRCCTNSQKTRKAFVDATHQMLDSNRFKTLHHFKTNGHATTTSSVFVGYRRSGRYVLQS
ncbi:hypothetical protein ABBQ38_009921 [Trebouxia sp. C0009 RCD-2024]